MAYDVLRAVTQRDAYANLLLPRLLTERGVRGRDAALATELTYGTLRNQGSYDAILDTCVDRSLSSVDADVLPLLRLGAHQLLATSIPAHIAVSATVNVARRAVGQHRARFANAVLRKVSARDMQAWLAVLAPDEEGDPVNRLALRHSHPAWIVAALADALGEDPTGELDETRRLLAAHNERPRVALVAKPGRGTVADLVAAGAQPGHYSPYGAYLADGGDPSEFSAVRQGSAMVQDEASQMVAVVLSRVPLPGAERVWLDTCAGPGGKAALLAGLAGQGSVRLVANEIRTARAGLVAGAVRNSIHDAARVVVGDARAPAWLGGAFDRVLVDAPCTGLGALRRRPEARWRRSPQVLDELVPLQRQLLDRALDSVRPGGVVAYVTCSPHRAETSEVVAAVTGTREDTECLRAADYVPEVADIVAGAEGEFVQFWPHRHGTDALFLALLRRV